MASFLELAVAVAGGLIAAAWAAGWRRTALRVAGALERIADALARDHDDRPRDEDDGDA